MKRLLAVAVAFVFASAGNVAWAADFVNLELRVTASGHELLASQRFRAPGATADTWSVSAGPQLGWQLLDEQGKVLTQGAVSDPRVLRGLLEPGKGHAVVMLPSVDYALRVPADARATDLRLMPLARAVSAHSRPTAQQARPDAGVPSQRIDVRGLMQPRRE